MPMILTPCPYGPTIVLPVLPVLPAMPMILTPCPYDPIVVLPAMPSPGCHTILTVDLHLFFGFFFLPIV